MRDALQPLAHRHRGTPVSLALQCRAMSTASRQLGSWIVLVLTLAPANLTGCKDLQDISVDGADTVMVDGKATYAGTVLALQAVGKQIRTVESLQRGAEVDEVVSGFVKHDAMQCGYCTPGFVVATRAFLDANPNATLEEIREICRGLGIADQSVQMTSDRHWTIDWCRQG